MSTSKLKAFIFMLSATLIWSPTLQATPRTRNTNISLQEKQKYGGTLVWGVTNPPTIINPLLTTHSISMGIIDLVFNGLIRIDEKGKLEPDLAERWEISEDKLTYTFYLRKGIHFHNGEELTAVDVAYTYEQLKDPFIQSTAWSHFNVVKEIKVVNKYEIAFILKEQFNPFLSKLNKKIVSKKLFADQELTQHPSNYHPIGTGPFRFQSWDRESNNIILIANDEYFEGRPFLDAIKVKVYRNNTELWTALMRQEIDMADYISREDFQVIQKDPDFKAHAVNWTMYCALLYDLIDPVLVDLDVRRAIAYAISRQEIINNLSEFGGLESTGPFHPESIGYNPDVQALEYNPVKAKMLLMHRGWVLNPSSGILEKEGRQFVINVLIDQSSDLYKKIVLNMRQQLAQLGIRLNVVYYNDESELTPEFLKEHHVQAWLRFFQGLGVDPYEAIDSWYSLTTQFGNIWPYKNTKVDELLLLGKIAQEEASKKAIYQQAHQLIYADQPACFLFYPASLFAVNSNFKNTDAYFSRYQATYTIKNWYIKTK